MKKIIISMLLVLAAVSLQAGNRAFDAVLESRDNSIRVVDSIAIWNPGADVLKATAGEYFTYQIGVKAYDANWDTCKLPWHNVT